MANIGSGILPITVQGDAQYFQAINQVPPANVTTDYITYTVPANKEFYLYQFDASTTSEGVFEITIDGAKIMSANHGHGNTNSTRNWALPRKVDAGQEVKVSFASKSISVSDLDVYLMASLI